MEKVPSEEKIIPQEKMFDGIKVSVVENKAAMSRIAADIILHRIKSLPKINILVPTGTTPEGVYEIFRNQPKDILSKVTIFNMDEYCIKEGDQYRMLPEDHPASYKRYMQEQLFSRLKPATNYFPTIDNIEHPGTYDELIQSLGGIDLCLNAMGEDGHTFGFNSPPFSAFDSVTRLVGVTEDTQAVNQGLTGLETPNCAITVGLKTGMQAKEILFLVCGERKAEILNKVIYSPEPIKEIPATVLKNHPNCHWIVDKAAASKL